MTCGRTARPSLSAAWQSIVAPLTAVAAVIIMFASAAEAANLLDPALAFRQLSTQHFTIYFHQGEADQAARLAAIAEETWTGVAQRLGLEAPRHTHVILVDQTELANGWATPLPYNTILVTAAAPAGSDQIGRTDDWLRLVFIHEFTHIVHLDRSAGWAQIFRGLFGRIPIAFPNLFLGQWQIEGLAAWEESVLTGEGRLHAGDFREIERTAARAHRIESIDRINGGVTDWPGGTGAYAYGLGFHQYLADRFGEQTLGALAAQTSRAIPYFGARAFRGVYNEPLGQLWREYEQTLEAEVAAARESTQDPVRLTHDGFVAVGPRFARSCASCEVEIVYSVRNPNGFPELRAIDVDGRRARKLTTRYLGSTVGVGDGQLVFGQIELRRNVGMYSDLYQFDWRTRKVRALTREQRLLDPDLSPDGRSIVSVREARGRRELVVVTLTPGEKARIGGIEALASEADTQFDAPRFSPDGRWIVAERRRLGSLSELVVIEAAGGALRVIASDPSARIVTPAWTPDGRNVVAAADYNESAFNLYEYPVDGAAPRQLTAVAGGAKWPDISRDGRTIVFVGYTADGFDLFKMPYGAAPIDVGSGFSGIDVGSDFSRIDVGSGFSRIDVGSGFSRIDDDATRPKPDPTTQIRLKPDPTSIAPDPTTAKYSPLPTLLPTYWTPIIELGGDQFRAGAAITGADVLGRHAYAVSATWLVDSSAPGSPPSRPVPDWSVGYAYDRWRPTLFASASRETTLGAGPADSSGRPTSATLAEYAAEAGALVPFRRVRHSHTALVALRRIHDVYAFAPLAVSTGPNGADRQQQRFTVDANVARFGWTTNTSHLYGYSVSPEDGVTIGGTTELLATTSNHALVTTLTADARAYLPAFSAHHILAIRAAGALSDGDTDAVRVFHLGGAAANASVMSFDRDAVSLLRGFPSDAFAGSRVALVNADYRWPLARPQRGIGTVPLLLHTLHASIFADAGHAWTNVFEARHIKLSAGAELSANFVAGYAFPFTIAFGAGWGRDGAHVISGGAAYVRVGRAF